MGVAPQLIHDGPPEKRYDFWMQLNNMDSETGRISANTLSPGAPQVSQTLKLFVNWCPKKGLNFVVPIHHSHSDAKDEFVQRYVLGNIGKVSWSEPVYNPEADSVHYEFKRNLGLFPQPIDHTLPCDEGPLSPSLTQRLPPLDISSDEILQLGYMPFRDDYEKVESDINRHQYLCGINKMELI